MGESESATAGVEQILSLSVEFAANDQCRDLPSLIQTSTNEVAASFITVPLFLADRCEPLAYSDLCLSFEQWNTLVVGVVSDDDGLWSDDPATAAGAVDRLERELRWAKHLSLSAVLLPRPPSDLARLPRYAALLYPTVLEHVSASSAFQLWIRIGLNPSSPEVAYTTWRKLHALCENSLQFYPVLEPVSGSEPKDVPVRAMQPWIAEHVAAIVLDQTFPKPVWMETLLNLLFRHDVRVIVGQAENAEDLDRLEPVCEWAHSLWNAQPAPTQAEVFAAGYRDVLQVPLQPLGDHLQSQTYEIFEKDPVKYERYEEAVYRALLACKRCADGEEIVVMVVGAGRGPLVHCVLSASERSRRPVRLFALEKNPNACVTLRHLSAAVWGQRVEVVEGDMRSWEPPVQADIVVSELLGSFGDNELSPECLDGARRLLRHDGVSIPSSYTSYLAPISCPRLWNQIASSGLASLETLHVVNLHAVFSASPVQECFTFSHPDNVTNNRRRRLLFVKDVDEIVIHGFAGFFRAILFDGGDRDLVDISIEPSTFSNGMFSWFPAFLPLRRPIVWRHDDPLQVEISRTSRLDQKRVWGHQRSRLTSVAGSIPRITVQDWTESVANLMLTEPAVQSAEFVKFIQSPEATTFTSAAYFYFIVWKKVHTLRSPVLAVSNHRNCDQQLVPAKPWNEIWKENPRLQKELDDSIAMFAERYAALLLRYSHADPMLDREFFDNLFDFTLRILKVGFAADTDLFPAIHQELRRMLYSKSFMGKIESDHTSKLHVREKRRIRDSLKACSPLISALLHSTGMQSTPRKTSSFIYGITAEASQGLHY